MTKIPCLGVRYGKLVGPGPTGFRPEHLKEMLAVPRLREALSLQKALNRLHYTMLRGELADSMRWLTRTRLCWQKKKNGIPRPIKIGELLRSSYAKRTVHRFRRSLRPTLLNMRQWGVGMPGSVEALGHWRSRIEELMLHGTLEPVVAADLDLVNMFGNIAWPFIRDALQNHFQEALSWTSWQHQASSTSILPSGEEFSTDRGADRAEHLVVGACQVPSLCFVRRWMVLLRGCL